MNKKAFTLVELIVVITILAVLATVAFISFQGYAVSSRDSARLSDIASMQKVLELYNVKNSKYPIPDNGTNITYSGSIAWTQGVFGTSAYTDSSSMSNVPVDPVTGLEYPYSVTETKKEYQIAAILEQPVSSKLTNKTFAGTQEAEVLVKGNYNGKFLKVRKNTTTYLLGVPSILVSDITSIDLETIITNKKLVYKGFKNLPASFSGSIYNTNPTNGFNFAPAKLILFEGDIQDLKDNQSTRITFLENLQTNYTGSPIVSETSIAEILAIDSNSVSASSNYVATALNNSLKMNIDIIQITQNNTSTCPENPSPENYFTFDLSINTITSYSDLGSADIIIPCQIGGVDVLYIGNNSFSNRHITSVIIPETIIDIGTSAFYRNNLTSVIVPNNVINIGSHAFSTNQLTSIIIPDSVTSIGYKTFYSNQLNTVTIPGNIISIGSYAFQLNKLIDLNIIVKCNLPSFGTAVFYGNGPLNLTHIENPTVCIP